MTFTISNIAPSLASYLSAYFPGVSFYEDPNQQGTQCPCMFLQQRYSYIELRQNQRYLRRIGLDLTYLEDFNLPNMQQLYQNAAEVLDEQLETFPYSDGETTSLLRTYDRSWTIDLDAMHYKFELQVWVYEQKDEALMQTMEYTQEVKDGG